MCMATTGTRKMEAASEITYILLTQVSSIIFVAQGHIKALERLDEMTNNYNYDVFNLGSGSGYSVFEVIRCF